MGTSFASFLGQILRAPVVELVDGSRFEAGTIYVAPGRKHTEVLTKGRVRVFDDLPDATYSPSLDYFLWSVARVYGRTAIGVILTGMGADGAAGAAGTSLDMRDAHFPRRRTSQVVSTPVERQRFWGGARSAAGCGAGAIRRSPAASSLRRTAYRSGPRRWS